MGGRQDALLSLIQEDEIEMEQSLRPAKDPSIDDECFQRPEYQCRIWGGREVDQGFTHPGRMTRRLGCASVPLKDGPF